MKWNKDRFPEDFMFVLTKQEIEKFITIAPRLTNMKHSSVNPMVFTEQAVFIFSSVLSSKKVVQINIKIMRAFSGRSALILENNKWKREVKVLDIKLNEAFKYLFKKMDAFYYKYDNRIKIGCNGGSDKE